MSALLTPTTAHGGHIGDAVDAGEVIDLFAAAGLDAARLDILSEDFFNLNRVSLCFGLAGTR